MFLNSLEEAVAFVLTRRGVVSLVWQGCNMVRFKVVPISFKQSSQTAYGRRNIFVVGL